MKVMKDTKDNYKLTLKRYDQRLNFLMNIYPPPQASLSMKSQKLIESILELERKEETMANEIFALESQFDYFTDEISVLNEEICLLEREKNSLEEEEHNADEDFHEILSLVSATRSEINLLSQNLSSKSLFSMSWRSSFFISSSPPSSPPPSRLVDPAPPLPSSSLSLSSFLSQSLPLAVFSITPQTLPSFTSPSSYPSSSLEQKILCINRIRVSYCPVSASNLNWGEICLGWSIVGTFLQGFLHEMTWICSQISSNKALFPPLRWTYRMVLLRGKVVFVRSQSDEEEEEEGRGDKEGSPLYRLYCTEEEVLTTSAQQQSSSEDIRVSNHEIGSSEEYQTALICLGILIIELMDSLQEVLQSHWSTIPDFDPLTGFGSLSNCPALRSLKSFSQQSSSLYRNYQWPDDPREILICFPDKGAYVTLVNDLLTVVSHLQTLHLED
jgi:hypothetical protein